MEHKIEATVNFLKNNPNSTKLSISEAIDFKGLPLFNLLKKLEAEGTIVIQGESDDKTYSLTETADDIEEEILSDDNEEEVAGDDNEEEVAGDDNEEEVAGDDNSDEVVDENTELNTEVSSEGDDNIAATDTEAQNSTETPPAADTPAVVDAPPANVTPASIVIPAGRDNSKYKFDGQEYGKGPVVRAVVAKHVANHPGITLEQLKAVFPDTLLKRFGIFQTPEQAKIIANKGNRYFTKDEQIIELADAKVVVCNQFTLENLQPFLKAARELGYVIE